METEVVDSSKVNSVRPASEITIRGTGNPKVFPRKRPAAKDEIPFGGVPTSDPQDEPRTVAR